MMVQLQTVYLIQPTNINNYSVKIERKLVKTQPIKPKGIKQVGVHEKPNPTLQDFHQREKSSINPSMESNFALVAIRHIHILKDVECLPKGS